MNAEDYKEITGSTWPTIALRSCMIISTGIGLCVFYYYFILS